MKKKNIIVMIKPALKFNEWMKEIEIKKAPYYESYWDELKTLQVKYHGFDGVERFLEFFSAKEIALQNKEQMISELKVAANALNKNLFYYRDRKNDDYTIRDFLDNIYCLEKSVTEFSKLCRKIEGAIYFTKGTFEKIYFETEAMADKWFPGRLHDYAVDLVRRYELRLRKADLSKTKIIIKKGN